MQFQRVLIDGKAQWSFALTKPEAAVFTHVGRNKKGTADEQAVRFGFYGVPEDGFPCVWATDGVHLVIATPRFGFGSDCPKPEVQWCTRASTLKDRAAKMKTAQMLVVPLGSSQVFLAPKTDLGDPLAAPEFQGPPALELTPMEALHSSSHLSWGSAQLMQVLDITETVENAGSAAPRQVSWTTGGRFSTTLALVAKAAGESAMTWITMPLASDDAPLIVRTQDEIDGCWWTIAIMPRGAK